MSQKSESVKAEAVDVEKIVETGKAVFKGETAKVVLPEGTGPEQVSSRLESLGEQVEQVRYAEQERLSHTGQAVLKDLEQILTTSAEATAAIPPETFLHAARAQQAATEAYEALKRQTYAGTEEPKWEEAKARAFDLAGLARMLVTSKELRDFLLDWADWLNQVFQINLDTMKQKVKAEAAETSEQADIEVQPIESGEPAAEEPAVEEKPVAEERPMEEKPAAEEHPMEEVKVPPVPDELLDRLIGLLDWMQDREEYQRAFGFLCDQLQYIPELQGRKPSEEAEAMLTDEQKKKLAKAADEAKAAALDALKAVESWTSQSFAEIPTRLESIGRALAEDEELSNAISAFGHFLRNCFLEPGFLNDRAWIRSEARDRIDELRRTIGSKHHNDFDVTGREVRRLLDALQHETKTTQLKESLRKLLEDLFMTGDEEGAGQFRLKTELMSDLGVLVGGLAQKIRFLRVPDVEIHDDEFDFFARDVILDAAELLPQQFKLTLVTENMTERAKFPKFEGAHEGEEGLTDEEKHRLFVNREIVEKPGPSPLEMALPIQTHPADIPLAPEWHTHLKFECKGIRGHCRNVRFHMRKKTGFPQLSDEGTADLRVWGRNGMLIKVILRPEWVKERIVERTVTSQEKIVEKAPATIVPGITSTAGMAIPGSAAPSGVVHSATVGTSAPVPASTATSTTTTVPATTSVETSASESSTKLRLSVVKARCTIDELDLDLHGTRRDWFYTILGPLVRRRVRQVLESSIERNLLTLMD